MDINTAISALPPKTDFIGQGLSLLNAAGGDKNKKRPYDMGDEMKKYGKTPMKYDDNQPASDIVKKVAGKMGINPSLLMSSAWQEGMNKSALRPDDVSQGYNDAKVSGDFPVDGYLNYGIDTIGDKYEKLKKYLPAGFEKQMQTYKTTNEKGENITTAAFKNNESALTAKAAMMKGEMDNVNNSAGSKKLTLDDKAKNYFLLASYNGGFGNAKKMIDEYEASSDKSKFIDEGLTSLKGIHKNIKPRLDNMAAADEILK